MSYMIYGIVALAVLVAVAYVLLSRKQTRDIIIWLKWPPPGWVFALAAVVVVAAAAIIFTH